MLNDAKADDASGSTGGRVERMMPVRTGATAVPMTEMVILELLLTGTSVAFVPFVCGRQCASVSKCDVVLGWKVGDLKTMVEGVDGEEGVGAQSPISPV